YTIWSNLMGVPAAGYGVARDAVKADMGALTITSPNPLPFSNITSPGGPGGPGGPAGPVSPSAPAPLSPFSPFTPGFPYPGTPGAPGPPADPWWPL
uniref:Uncharacterized protein n=1 Tax=Seriola lalandi dorsalis TaxID=1841481 RepID=A0A3B4Y8W9_SERLL